MRNTCRQPRSSKTKYYHLSCASTAQDRRAFACTLPLLPNRSPLPLLRASEAVGGNKENRLRRWPQRTELRFYMWQNISPRGVQTDRQTDGHRTVRRGAEGWAVLSSNLLVEAAPHPQGVGQHWHRRWRDRREVPIPEVGSWAGPSPRWHNRLSLDQL